MSDSDTLRNLAAAAVQMACLAVLAEVLLRAAAVAAAGFRYAYWRVVLVAALAAPWLLRSTLATASSESDSGTAALTLSPAPFTEAAAIIPAGPEWPAYLLWVLATGVVLRLLWVAAGLVRLRACRRSGTRIDAAAYEDLQQRLGTRAEIRAVPGLGQPVTFGLRRPVVLLPQSLAHAEPSLRRAVVAHELVHVNRRDWAFLLLEEIVRALFWFHPAIWWLTARVRLAREEFTDHLAVLATGDRRAYIDALLAFADAPQVMPAAAFIRRPNLFARIVLLTKESAMSSRRIAVSAIVLTLALGAGGWYLSEAFPVRAARPGVLVSTAPPAAQQGPASAPAVPRSVTPENPIPRRLFATPIPYPLELAGTGFESALSIRVVLDENGAVQSASAGARAVAAAPGRGQALVSESEAMDRFATAAVDAIARWQYVPPVQAPLSFYLSVVFKPGAAAVVAQSERAQAVRAGPEGARMLTPQEQVDFEARTPADRAARVKAAERSAGPFAPSDVPPQGAVGGPLEPLRVAPPPPPPPPAPRGPIRVGGNVRAPVQVRKVSPVYPEEARAARVQGVVILEAIIGADGRVDEVRVLRSIPLLDQAAIDAVRQWEYAPTMLNGLPVPIVMTVTVQFSLS